VNERLLTFAERMHRFLRDAFDLASLQRMLLFRLQQRLDHITPADAELDTVVFRLVLWADQHGRMLELARAAALERPGRPDAQELVRLLEADVALAPPATPADGAPDSAADVCASLEALARAYERIKQVMPEGNQRTVVMEEMVTRMRELPLEEESIPARFHLSSSDGRRLAATVALRKRPAADYLRWLSERLAVEYAFIGYQAAVALREAAVLLPGATLDQVAAALQQGLEWLSAVPPPSGRRDMLNDALKVIADRARG
jgi:hypothetical protein